MSVDRKLASLFNISEDIINGLTDNVEKELIETYRAQFKEIDSILSRTYAKFGKDVTFGEMQKFNRLVRVQEDIAEELKRLGVETNGQLRASIGQSFEKSYNYTGFQESILGFRAGIGGLDKETIRANIVNPLDQIKWPVRHRANIGALNGRIKQSLAEGFIQGYGYQKSSRNVRGLIGRNQFETMRILRTEGQRAKSAGKIVANEKIYAKAKSIGMELEEIWDATRDSRTRPAHRALDGKARNKSGFWVFNDGVKTVGPGQSGVAKHDIQCRCFTRTSLKDSPEGWEPETQKAYNEWAKDKNIKIDPFDAGIDKSLTN